jgi:predicted NAD/FAD-dependent oxidoreductase
MRDAGFAVHLYDDGCTPGGRIATQGGAAEQFDDGAQYFTARDPRFKSAIASWLRAGVVAEWRARIVRVTHDRVAESKERVIRYVGYPAMASLPAHLAQGFQIGYEKRAVKLERVDGGLTLRLEDGSQTLPYSKVVAAVPAPRAAALFDPASELGSRIAAIDMEPCWAIMLQFEKGLDARFDGAIIEDGPIAWIARDSSKPGRRSGERWVVHASGGWSAEHFEAKSDEVIAGLMQPFCELVERRVSPVAAATKRWLHSRAPDTEGPAYLYDAAAGLGACGDWLVGGRVEGAFLSGLAMGSALLQGNGRNKPRPGKDPSSA